MDGIPKYQERLLIYFFLCTTIFLPGCEQTPDLGWVIKKKPQINTSFFQPFHPQIQTIELLNRPLVHEVILATPYIPLNDTTKPSVIYSLLTELNETKQIRQTGRSWYILRFRNFSNYEQWVIKFNDQKLLPKLYLKVEGKKGSPSEMSKISIPWKVNNRFVEEYFKLSIPRLEEVHILINIRNDQIPYVNQFSIYPYSNSISKPINPNLRLGTLFSITVVIITLLVYCSIVTKELLYPVSILYFLYWAASLFIWEEPFSIGLKTLVTLNIYHFCTKYIVIALLPFNKIIFSKKIIVLASLILLYLLTDYSSVFSNIYIGDNYARILELGVLASYLIYLLDKRNKQNRYRLAHVIAGAIAILWIALFIWTKIFGHYQYMFNLYLAEILLLLIALILRFVSFRNKMRLEELERNKAAEKQISQRVIKTLEDERRRISQDIHDELGGNLAVLKIKIQTLNNNRDQLELIMKIIDNTSDSVRSISHKLMPPYFAESDLMTVLTRQFEQLSESGPTKIDIHTMGEAKGFTKENELMIYRIVMELIQNCLKHAHASGVTVELNYSTSELEIICQDNGVGFSSSLNAGIGLQSINTRTLYLGGTINIDTAPTGTTVIIHIPYEK